MRFESSVVLDGTKTLHFIFQARFMFESSVVLDGTKTRGSMKQRSLAFESSVVLDGTKTTIIAAGTSRRLRVVLF